MKKLLMIVDASLAALGITMGMVQAVVCVLYLFTLDESPALSREMPMLVASTAIFTVLGLLFLASFIGLLRQRTWRWPVQVLVFVAIAPASLALYALMTR